MKSFLLILVSLLIIPDLSGQEWKVPDDKKGKLSTFPFNDKTRNDGLKLYSINCLSCHGTPGKSNFLKLVPPPPDPATEQVQKNSDGEIYYKVSTGRGQMPSFKSVLSSDELWKVVSFIRSFNPSYKQQIKPAITSSAHPGAVIRLLLSYNQADSSVILRASAIKDNNSVPVTGAEVKLLVHRTFGMLPVNEVKTTDKTGEAVFMIPHSLPGDTAGNILVSARFINEDIFGSVSRDTLLRSAIKITPVSLVATRAMWNNVRMAPLWIILTYTLGLFSALGFIVVVMMKLRDIFIIGETVTNDKDIN
jgi:hypothetical protein